MSHPNDLIYVHIHFVTGLGQATITDESSGFSGTYQYRRSGIQSDNTAEWIYERTEQNDTGSPYLPILADATTTFTQAKATPAHYSATPLGQLPHYWLTMETCLSPGPVIVLANPGGISSDGLSFTDVWKVGGHEDTPGCRT